MSEQTESGQLLGHLISEYRLLRQEITSIQREHRTEMDTTRESHHLQIGTITKMISDLALQVSERNGERKEEHRVLATRVSFMAAGISLAISMVWAFIKDFFFR